MNRYDTIIVELAACVPELADECQPEVVTFLEQCQYGQKEPLSDEDIAYLRELQAANPDQCRDEINPPLTYIVFESSLFPLLLEMLNDSERHARLREVMDWLEELAGDDEINVRNLVAISICEQLLGNHPERLPALLPFIGEKMRQSCRDCYSALRVSDENKRLLN